MTEQRMIFCVTPPEGKVSYARALTARRKALLARGIHPTTMEKLAGNGETCGTCDHHYVRHYGGTYHKCDLCRDTAGHATDLRVRWPACVKWRARA